MANATNIAWEKASAGTDTTLGLDSNDDMVLALVAATDIFQITTGNLKVGAGTQTTTFDGADAYITGFLEVDGLIYAGSSTTALTDSAGKILSAALNTVAIGQGGTGAVAVTTNGIVYGASSTAYGVTAVGAEGQLLRVGASPFVPAWTTLTMPTTIADGSVFAANAANTLSAITYHDGDTKVLTNTAGTISWEAASATDATLVALAGLTIADVTIIEGTGVDAFAVVASGGNNYILGSNSGNTALEFKTPANVLSQIGAQATDTDLTAIAALTVAQGKFIVGSADPAWSLSAYALPIVACTEGQILKTAAGGKLGLRGRRRYGWCHRYQ